MKEVSQVENTRQGCQGSSPLTKAWLTGLIVLVLLMIAIGGFTRLTRSGLSIPEWRPIVGSIPPFTENDWNDEFNKYKRTPEYEKLNYNFSLSDYKSIYLWEYIHRLIARLTFLYVLVFGIYLWWINKIAIRIPIYISTFVAFQGTIGWIMVKSGLRDKPMVSPYLLSIHYFMALGIVVYAYYLLCRYRKPIHIKKTLFSSLMINLIGLLLTVQIFYGCLTSGFKAGYLSDTFPLMHGAIVPESLTTILPPYLDLVKNPFLIHWLHRWMGISTFVLIVVFSFLNLKQASLKGRGPFYQFLGISGSQIILGIATVTLHVPTVIAVTHQITAALIVLSYFNIIFRTKYVK